MKLVSILLVLFCLSISFAQNLSGTYYIGIPGSGPGGTNPDYPSLDSAFKAINSSTITGDCIFYITSNLTEPKNVALGKYIAPFKVTFKPYTGTVDTITFTQVADNAGASGAIVIGTPSILITSATNYGLVTTNNIIFDGSNTIGGTTKDLVVRTAAGINANTVPIRIIGDVNNVVIKNLKVVTGQSVSYAIALINRFFTPSNFTPDSITVNNCDVTNTFGLSAQGIAITNSGTPTTYPVGIVFSNNTIVARTRGVFLNYSGNTDIFNNNVQVNQTSPGLISYGIWGFVIGDTLNTTNIYNNQITLLSSANHLKGDYGIVGIEAGSKGYYNIYNNMISGFTATTATSGASAKFFGMRFQSAPVKANVYFNSIYMSDLSINPADTGIVNYSGIFMSNGMVDFKNNIVMSDENDFASFCIYRSGTTGTLISNHNDLFVSDSVFGKIGFWNLDSIETLAGWTAATNLDSSSISANPEFNSASNLHLASQLSPVIGGGVAIPGFGLDIDGDTRDVPPEIGADELSGIIPVELASFTAHLSDSKVYLEWSTSSEINNHAFEVQRKAGNENWTNIGLVYGMGTTAEAHSYSYIDSELPEGKLYYRLKQIDLNGSFSYSNIVEINSSGLTSYELLQNYPNPFNPSTEISFVIPVDSKVRLEIFSITGELVEVIADEFLASGKYTYSFNAGSYASGTYIYRLTAGSNILSKKMLLLK
jgi:hypothetical protein